MLNPTEIDNEDVIAIEQEPELLENPAESDLEDRSIDLDVECAEVIEPLETNNTPQARKNVTWLIWLSYSIAALAAVSATMYAFLEPSHSKPEDVKDNWWSTLSFKIQVLSVLMAINTQVVNTVFFSFFVEHAFLKFKDSVGNCFNSCKDFSASTTNVALSSCAGLANGTIAYRSYLPLFGSRILAFFPSILNVTVTFASRYVGLINCSTRVADLFNSDARLQKKCLDYLKHIHPDIKLQINTFLENRPYGEETLCELMSVLSTQSNSVESESMREKLKDALGLGFDTLFAVLVILIASFMLFAQEGYDGMELLTNGATRELNQAEKIAIGFLPGLVSSIFMAINGFEFRQFLVDLCVHLRRHPQHIPIAILAGAMNAISAGVSWKNVAISTISSANIFSITSVSTSLGQVYIYFNALSSFMATFKPMGQKIIDLKPAPTQLDGLIGWTQKNRISHSTAEQLRRYSLFQAKPEPIINNHLELAP